MKKVILLALATVGIMSAQAQTAITAPGFDDNWSFGLDGGVTTPISHHAFFGSMRGAVGAHLQKQLSPMFALGVEGVWDVNTSSWYGHKRSTAFDNSYVGAYGAVNLFNLFGGYNCGVRTFDMELVAGAGWGHMYANDGPNEDGEKDFNYFATRAGLNFNFNINQYWTISLKPYVMWNMTGSKYNWLDVEQTTAAYDARQATFNFLASVSYHFGGNSFQCAEAADPAAFAPLNDQINALRAQIDGANAAGEAAAARVAALTNELNACKAKKPEVIKEVSNNLNTVRYIFYRIGSSKITADQQPNVEMVAQYLKNNAGSKVIIKGYASPDGNLEFNKKLAAARAESVKNELIKRYGIAADRITAEGEGIGDMFSENDWNRVSICTLEK